MSFDVFMQGFRDGDAGLADKSAVLRVLAGYPAINGDPNFIDIETADGGNAQVYLGDEEPFQDCMFAVYGFSPTLVTLIYEAAYQGGMVLLGPIADRFLVTAEDQIPHLPEKEDSPPPTILRSAEHLAEIAGITSDRWERYRDQVLGEDRG